MSKYIPCPCQSKQLYSKCCRAYHEGKYAENALILMRSRFSAYALGLVEYLIQTTDKENPSYMQDVQTWRIQIEAFCKNTQFVGLKILEFNDEGEIATVTFTAYLTQSSKDATFSECSRFRKIQGRWMYIDGVVKSTEG